MGWSGWRCQEYRRKQHLRSRSYPADFLLEHLKLQTQVIGTAQRSGVCDDDWSHCSRVSRSVLASADVRWIAGSPPGVHSNPPCSRPISTASGWLRLSTTTGQLRGLKHCSGWGVLEAGGVGMSSTAIELSHCRTVEQAQESKETAAACGRRTGQQRCRQMGVGAGQGRPARSSQAALYPRTEIRLFSSA